MEHDVSSFKEGRDTTLIIKDTGRREEGGRGEGGTGGREGRKRVGGRRDGEREGRYNTD